MNIRPCAADRTRALARLRKGRADHVRRTTAVAIEVRLGCGCVMEVDFNEPGLATALYRSIRHKIDTHN
jgi:hypothetical protein